MLAGQPEAVIETGILWPALRVRLGEAGILREPACALMVASRTASAIRLFGDGEITMDFPLAATELMARNVASRTFLFIVRFLLNATSSQTKPGLPCSGWICLRTEVFVMLCSCHHQ